MTENDPSLHPVVACLECTRNGQRQTIHLHLAGETVWKGLCAVLTLERDVAYSNIKLANGEIFVLDTDTIWFAYLLPGSYSYSANTLILGKSA